MWWRRSASTRRRTPQCSLGRLGTGCLRRASAVRRTCLVCPALTGEKRKTFTMSDPKKGARLIFVTQQQKCACFREDINFPLFNVGKMFEFNGASQDVSLGPIRYLSDQGCIFRLTCSHPDLTKDHVLTSAYVKFFRTVTRNAVNKSV